MSCNFYYFLSNIFDLLYVHFFTECFLWQGTPYERSAELILLLSSTVLIAIADVDNDKTKMTTATFYIPCVPPRHLYS